jgi:hypothetical protein
LPRSSRNIKPLHQEKKFRSCSVKSRSWTFRGLRGAVNMPWRFPISGYLSSSLT